MKSYLERIAASAINPVPSIRPVLTPVFASLRPEATPVPEVLPEATVTMSEEPEAPRRSPDLDFSPSRQVPNTRPDRLESPTDRTVLPSPAVVGRQRELPDRIFYKPLGRLDPVPAASEPQRHRTSTNYAEGNSESPAQVESASQTEAQTARQIGSQREARIETQSRVDIRVPVLSTASERERGESLVPSQSDNIQIHIGRIEVTAIQSPAPPALPKRARETPNLDEYLRRSR